MAPRKKKPTGPVPVESVRHDERRTTIPTAELADLVPDDADRQGLRYPRDPSLDPQLVWKGKDDEDGRDLVVNPVPIYVQEKIVPQALVENLRKTSKGGEPEPEATLFDDFDGLDDLEMVEFYEHDKGHWANRMILGDSLAVMASLAEREDLRGKVQMIYVDPPYGIKFGSNWQVSTRKRTLSDGNPADATREPEQVKAFRDTWELGIHSYLSYLRDRLEVARDLLVETGSCFVQIGDENVHRVRAVMDEVFGEENFVSQIALRTTTTMASGLLGNVADYVLWFAKDKSQVKYRQLFAEKAAGSSAAALYRRVRLENGEERPATDGEREDPSTLPRRARLFRPGDLTNQRPAGDGDVKQFEFEGRTYTPGKGKFKTDLGGLTRLGWAGRLYPTRGRTLQYERYLDDFPAYSLSNIWTDVGTGSFTADKVYVVQTNVKIVQRCMLMTTDPGDLVLDPTCGSGTTAFVAEQWGRRWITTDTSRVALALARTRLMSARFPSYLLTDSNEGAQKEAELTGQPAPRREMGGDVRQGFVYKRVPHITLKSIAQNPDIVEGMSREEVDAAIAKHADTELLVDQPYIDNRKVRVSGRFTVESLSPHRELADDLLDPTTPDAPGPESMPADPEAASFEAMILDNLRAAGVQNTYKDERLGFERLEPTAGEWIQAEGVAPQADGDDVRVAVSIGPEHGTVGSDQLLNAAQEAARSVPKVDLVLVVGFAFEPGAWQKATQLNDDLAERQVGSMRVLLAKANPDLAMGDDLLKKTGAGNLFMIFGEPDVEITRTLHSDGPDGLEPGEHLTVEVKGLDVYDPTRGEVRTASTDDLAAWFIDTDYDGRSFFVRHAYFTGGQKPYESLSKALKADIDADAWASLYSTISRPFPVPSTGKIAVKVINHYGDEVLQVYDVSHQGGT